MKLANSSLFFTFSTFPRPSQPHRSYKEVRTNFSRFEKLHKEFSKLFLIILIFIPIVFAFIFSSLLKTSHNISNLRQTFLELWKFSLKPLFTHLFIASHNDNLYFTLNNHSPKVIDRVRKWPLKLSRVENFYWKVHSKCKTKTKILLPDWQCRHCSHLLL